MSLIVVGASQRSESSEFDVDAFIAQGDCVECDPRSSSTAVAQDGDPPQLSACTLDHNQIEIALQKYYTACPGNPGGKSKGCSRAGIRKGARRRAGTANYLRGEISRLASGGPSHGCGSCEKLFQRFDGAWQTVVARSRATTQLVKPIQAKVGSNNESDARLRWLVYSHLDETFIAFAKCYLTECEFNNLPATWSGEIWYFNQSWKQTQAERRSLKLESQHQRQEREYFVRTALTRNPHLLPPGVSSRPTFIMCLDRLNVLDAAASAFSTM